MALPPATPLPPPLPPRPVSVYMRVCGDGYIIESIRNASYVTTAPGLGARIFRVGDIIDTQTADEICDQDRYETDINRL